MERKEAIEVIKNNWPDSSFTRFREALEALIPELKETEDERIRKECISIIDAWDKSCRLQGDYCESAPTCIAWLEKQGEQKSTNIVPIPDGCYAYIKNRKIYIENYTKTMSADKVKPKFKAGDWIISHYNHVAYIKSIDEKNYFLSCSDGNSEKLSIDCINRNWRLWTIRDAKDGDVLVCVGKRPFIFKGLEDKFHPDKPVAYCGIDSCNGFITSGGTSWWTDDEVSPATKEQQNFLFQKMNEAGYMWDAEKKESKKIEENSFENDRVVKAMHEAGYEWSEETHDLKKVMQKSSEWSEEDKKMKESIIKILYGGGHFAYEPEIRWLKSLKLQNTWKPSEEQMDALESAVSSLQSTALESLYQNLKRL